MFSTRIIKIISIVIVAIGIIGLVTWYFWPRTVSPVLGENPSAEVSGTNPVSAVSEINNQVITGAATSEGALDSLQTARFVAERFASFSSEANFSNIESVYPFFTKEVREWAMGYVAQQRALAKPDAQPYRVESRVVGTKTQTVTDTTASYTLQLQQQEERGSGIPSTRQRNLMVDLIQVDGVWLIDNLKWE